MGFELCYLPDMPAGLCALARHGELHRALVAAARSSEKASRAPDCGEKDQFNLLYGAWRFVRRLNEFGIAHRYEELPDNHTGRLPGG